MEPLPTPLRRRSTSKGQSLVETAIVLPILIVFCLSFVDLASVLFTYLQLGDGVAQATRYAVTGRQADDPDRPGMQLSREQSVMRALRTALPTLVINDGDVTFYNVKTHAPGIGGPNDLINVRVIYKVPLVSPALLALVSDGTITLRVSTTMKNEPFPTT